MQKIFAASDAAPAERISYWHDVASKIYVGHQSRIADPETFDASISAAELGELNVSILETTAAQFDRTAQDIVSLDDGRNAFICAVSAGALEFGQDDRFCTALPGDLVFLDAQRPYSIATRAPARLLVVKLPHRAMEQRVGPTKDLTALLVPAADQVGALASGFLAMLPQFLSFPDVGASDRIAEQTLDLTAMALSAAAARARPRVASARAVALAKLHQVIDRHLADPDINPVAIAGAAGISVRYANQLLAEQGTSIVKLIHTRRVEKCRRVLADPRNVHRAITEIAMAWGFSDLSHFGRRFREQVGYTPREYRAICLNQPEPPSGS